MDQNEVPVFETLIVSGSGTIDVLAIDGLESAFPFVVSRDQFDNSRVEITLNDHEGDRRHGFVFLLQCAARLLPHMSSGFSHEDSGHVFEEFIRQLGLTEEASWFAK